MKLLRALESRHVRRLGGDRPRKVDVRVVAATNRSLAVEVSRRRFREDLYYRLAVVKLRLPPLRERREDVSVLTVHLLRKLEVAPERYLTPEALEVLTQHDWPGNVRELRNAME